MCDFSGSPVARGHVEIHRATFDSHLVARLATLYSMPFPYYLRNLGKTNSQICVNIRKRRLDRSIDAVYLGLTSVLQQCKMNVVEKRY